jgi:multiple sugar transport system permease protein
MNSQTKITKESKNKIKVDFERAPLAERLKAKYLNSFFYKKLLSYVFRFLLLLGISYVILYPFASKIMQSVFSPVDLIQTDVLLVSKYPTLDTYKYLITENSYLEALFNTALLSLMCAVIQTFVCAFIGYGFAKFKFKGNGLVFIFVLFTLLVPHKVIASALVQHFVNFDFLGILEATVYKWFGMNTGLQGTYAPFVLMSATGLGFKNGLFVLIFRQFYRGIPDELEEASYVDGYGVFKTFFRIILPCSVHMLITVFILSFSWQWTDIFYTNLFLPNSDTILLTSTKFWSTMPVTLKDISESVIGGNMTATNSFSAIVMNTAGMLVVAPLIILYLFCQRYLIQGIEHSGFGGV